jgi:hypothetical protein
MEDRFERQRDLVPCERLAELTATVIGVGAIGRQVALQLASIGVRHLQLIDFDRVEPTNITTQAYFASDVGRLKVEAVAAVVAAIDPTVCVEGIADRFRAKQAIGEAAFCCVDTISSRAAIWRSIRNRCRFWVDGRMLGEVIRVLAASDHASRKYYDSTLFAQSEAQSGRCTSRSTIYAANIAAGFMLHQFSRWLRGLPLECDIVIDLLAGELTTSLNEPTAISRHPRGR